jgi:predicted nucleotidyltransferase
MRWGDRIRESGKLARLRFLVALKCRTCTIVQMMSASVQPRRFGGVVPTLDAAVLEALDRSAAPLSLTAVHRMAEEGSLSGVRKTLQRLVETGLVDAEGSPPRYSLNRDHLAYPAVQGLTRIRQRLLQGISEHVRGWASGPSFVGIFGSVARGDAVVGSDVDVLVVGEPSDDEVTGLVDAIRRWVGAHAQIVVLSLDELEDAVSAGEPIIEEWRTQTVKVGGSDDIKGLIR